MPGEDRRSLQHRKGATGRGNALRKRSERILNRRHEETDILESTNHVGPARTVGVKAVYQDDAPRSRHDFGACRANAAEHHEHGARAEHAEKSTSVECLAENAVR